jgi:hypothetical protein
MIFPPKTRSLRGLATIYRREARREMFRALFPVTAMFLVKSDHLGHGMIEENSSKKNAE